MSGIWDWSPTASANTSIDGIGCNTGMSPANVDNVFRSIAALVRQSFASALQNFLGGTAALPIANGGTNATDAATALSNLGGLSSTYRDLPAVVKTASFTFADSERAGLIVWNAASPGTGTINNYATTPITVGGVYVIYNPGSTALTLTPGSGVWLAKNGAAASSTATLAPGAVATLIHASNDVWVVNGSGVS